MTYFGVLGTFILPPLVVLLILVPRDVWRGRATSRLPYAAVLLHVLIAVLYTTPWDNYLVATDVWWYDPALVTGLRIGWVPIEEYTFFVVQTLLTGLWTVELIRWLRPSPEFRPSGSFRFGAAALAGLLWLGALVMLLSGWQPGRYLALILVWALLPLALQLAYGADILLANVRLLAAAIIPPTLYLWLVDALAITDGTWTINPAQTTGFRLGPLPVEEMLFFLMTNVIIAYGITLMLSPAGAHRFTGLRARLGGRPRGAKRIPFDIAEESRS